MKKLTATLLATAVATVAMPTFADTGMYAGLKGGKYLVKKDFTKDIQPSYINDKEPSYASAVVGYQLNNNIGFEVEYGSSGTKSYGITPLKSITESDPEETGVNEKTHLKTETELSDRTTDEKIQHLGAYVTARYDIDTGSVPMYIKARAGASQVKYENTYKRAEKTTITPVKTTVDATGTPTSTEGTARVVDGSFQTKRSTDKVSASGGVAVGVKPLKSSDKLSVELEYNYLNKDIQSIGFGTQYRF